MIPDGDQVAEIQARAEAENPEQAGGDPHAGHARSGPTRSSNWPATGRK